MGTVRQQMIDFLLEEEMDARELSQRLHVTEKEVFIHLTHVARSVSAQNQRLVMTPSRCLKCGYSFKTRKRPTRPSRCPCCKSERIAAPTYRIL